MKALVITLVLFMIAGFAGNSRYDHVGGGTNYQCMPNQAVYNKYYGNSGGVGTVYNGFIAGVEYQTYTYGVFPNEAHDDNVPCAVCYANNRPSVIMIPAQRNCPTDWQKEYEGILILETFKSMLFCIKWVSV